MGNVLHAHSGRAEADVLRWLRQAIAFQKVMGEGVTPCAINPRARISRLLQARDVEVLEVSILRRWGRTIVIGAGDTVEATAAAISNALTSHPLPEQESTHA